MKKCLDCHKILTGHNNPKRCRSCAQKLNKKNFKPSLEHRIKISKALLGDKHPLYIDGRSNQDYNCTDCGKKISRHSGFYGSGKCHSCVIKGRKATLKTRSKMSLVHGGTGIPYELTEYGAEFDNNIREQVRFRDKYKCQICGCSQLENSKQLDVHHIDYDKQNNKLNNLVALCRKCHSKTNYRRLYWQKYFKREVSTHA